MRLVGGMLRYVVIWLCLSGAAAAQSYSGPARVVDGDTLDLGLSHNIRLHGIDAPERGQICGALKCGAMVRSWLAQQTKGQRVICTQTAWDGRYSRPVAVCELPDGRDLGRMMVRAGLAWAYVKYSNDYVLEEKEAALKKRGVWGHVFETPAAHRAAARAVTPAADCVVKGNISPNSGEKIYHVAGQKHYRKVRINPSKGEACFETEAQARAAGWRKARR